MLDQSVTHAPLSSTDRLLGALVPSDPPAFPNTAQQAYNARDWGKALPIPLLLTV